MNARVHNTITRTMGAIAIIALLLPVAAVSAQDGAPPAPGTPFEYEFDPAAVGEGGVEMLTPPVGDSFLQGADRLTAMQYTDGSWGWPLIAPPTYANILGPIAMGLERAAGHTGDSSHHAALELAGAYLLTKTNNFSPSDGYLAMALDQSLGVTAYTEHVNTFFYGPLAAGTYNRNGAGTLYGTETYLNLIDTSRANSGIANLAAWDIGMGLVGAIHAGGLDETNGAIWVQAVEDEVNELDGNEYYDVIGLAGAVYGLAEAQQFDFNPTSGEHAMAGNLPQLGVILASYQLPSGGWTWNSQYQVPDDGNESIQETAYAILALNRLSWEVSLPVMVWGADYLYDTQLGTGGWENNVGSGENNEITGEALWALATVYRGNEVWVCETGDCGHPEMSFNTIQAAVDAAEWEGIIHVLPGTYPESVTIGKNVHLVGAGVGESFIQAPATLPDASQQGSAILIINGGDNVEITGFTVTGPGPTGCGSIRYGIFVRDGAHANIHDNTIQDIRDDAEPLSGCQNGVAIGVGRQYWGLTGDAEIINNTIVGHQKGGIVVDNTGSFAHIEGNTITGIGTTPLIAQNGIQVSRGADATITANTVSLHSFHIEGNLWDWGSAGVLLYQPGNVAFVGLNDVFMNDTNLYNEGANSIFLDGLTLGGSIAPAGIGMDITNYGTASIDATVASFTGAVDGFDIEDRVFHALDDNTLGLVSWTAGNLYVTLDSGSIQRGIDAASANDFVNVDAGTFAERLDVNKALTLAGAGVTQSIIDATGFGTAGNVIDITALTGDTTIQDFDILTGDYSNGIHFAGGSDAGGSIAIQDNHIIGTNFDSDQFGIIGGYMDVRAVGITGNEISNTYDNSILAELQMGPTEISGNTFNGAFPSVFFMTYDGHDVTPLQKVSDNTFDMSLAEVASGAAGVGVNPSPYFVTTDRRNGKYANFEISGNTFTGIADVSIKAISVGENSLDGATGGFDNLQIFANTISGTDGKGIQFFGHVTNASVYNNVITGLYQGLKMFTYESTFWPEGNDISCNQVTGASDKLVLWTGATPLTVELNWWGSAGGPTLGSMSANVDYTPWLTSEDCGGGTVPPYPTITTVVSSPDVTFPGGTVTIDITVTNDFDGAIVPVGTVDVGYPGLDPIPACTGLALDGLGQASCSYDIPQPGGVVLTAEFTPTDAGEFITSSGFDIHKVWMAPVDFDGDLTSDVTIWRGGAWMNYDFDTGTETGGIWTGNPGGSCIPAPMDYDGDGESNYTLFCGQAWHFYDDAGGYVKGIWLGNTGVGATPVPADYDGDGTDDVVAFKGGAWHKYTYATGAYSMSGSVWSGYPGGAGTAVALDYNGDGKSDRSILSPAGAWHFYNANGTYNKGIWIGPNPNNVAVPGDYDADGVDEPVVFQAGAWQFYDFATAAYLPGSSKWTGLPASTGSGIVGPAPVDFNGDEVLEFGYYSGDRWYFYNPNGSLNKSFTTGGVAGDLAISRTALH